jgi:O-antigen ligase
VIKKNFTIPSHWASYAGVASVFFAPLSASFQSISIVLTLLLVFCSSVLREELKSLCVTSWFMTAAGLSLLSVIATTWSLAPMTDIGVILGKYSKLLYLPCFVVAFKTPKMRSWAIHAFISAMVITCIISFLKKLGLCHYHGDDPAFVFRKHIMTGYMMAFAVYLCALSGVKAKNLKARFIYGVLALMMSYQVLFIGMGRSSYLTYFLLGGLFIIFTCSLRKCIWGFGLALGLILGIYTQSHIMQQRFHEAIYDWKAFHNQTNVNTPVGFRLQFHKFAQKQFVKHPWIGNGTSGLGEAFKIEQPIPAWGTRLFEPHSQYWLVAADWGVVGLILFCSFFISLTISSWPIKETRAIAMGMLFSFLLGCFFDSLLLYAGTGYFFLLFMGLSLGAKQNFANKTCNQTDSLDDPVLAV